MANTKAMKYFNLYIGSAVNYYKIKKGWTNHDLSIQSNLSESFIKQANTGLRHYNAYHLWNLARLIEVPIYKLYPPLSIDAKNFKQYKEIRPQATFDDFKNFVDLLSEYNNG